MLLKYNIFRLAFELCDSGQIVARISLSLRTEKPLGVLELAREPSLNSDPMALKVLCRGSLKGRLRGGRGNLSLGLR